MKIYIVTVYNYGKRSNIRIQADSADEAHEIAAARNEDVIKVREARN